ncbi:hypothetical protein CK203_064651 [Vitis vinifera]|uniref:Reverse transcriptase Ty1/copia-type domain-containing protein n=1 Tax=Vitis vinifera TaxID=29760 RepID=A0A438G9M0_VITVI|nr:hypothetical protein CK203_064651 [Vitis vinifera]
MGKLQIEDKRQQEEIGEDPKKEESPLALPPPQQVQGESSQDLPKDWKFFINQPPTRSNYSEFKMSMMGELNFFLGLQIKQLKEGTFINQAKYIRDLLKRFNMEEAKTMKSPMSSSIKLDKMRKGKHPAEPSQPTQMEAHQKARFDTTLFSIVKDYQRGVEIQLDSKSICRIFDITPIGLRFLGRMKFEKAPNGSWIKRVEQPLAQAQGQGQVHPGVENEVDIRKMEVDIYSGPSSQPSFTKPPHTETSPHQAPHAPNHTPWMDLSSQISSFGTRMKELAVVNFERMEDRMDQQQAAFDNLQQKIERIESRQESQHKEMMAYLHSIFPLPPPQP